MSTTISQTPDVVFIACNKNPAKYRQDASYFYRCENPAQALEQSGYKTLLAHCLDDNTLNLMPKLAIFHRPAFRNWSQTRHLKRLIKFYQGVGTTVIADFDDLVFDPAFAPFSPGVINQLVSLRQTQKMFRQHNKALALFDSFQVSTQPLANHLKRLGIENSAINLAHNSVPLQWRNIMPSEAAASGIFEIKYFPGTRSHDKDLADIIEPLRAFLADYPNARLQVTGKLDAEQVAEQLGQQQKQFEYAAKVPLTQYVQALNHGHVHLAPLQDTPFNQCKSALKAIESHFFERPVIASPIDDMQRLPCTGLTFAVSKNEWYQALEAQYQQTTKPNLRQDILKAGSVEKQIATLKQKLALVE